MGKMYHVSMIERKDEDGIAILQMQHGKANALDLEFLQALRRELAGCASAEAIVFTGRGRIFCAGVDLPRASSGDASYLEPFLHELVEFFTELFAFPKPVVAAMNGHAIAGGCILAMACDLRIAAAGTWRMGAPELEVGVPFPPIALEILRFAAPGASIGNSVYFGKSWQPQDAVAAGVVDVLVGADDLGDRALAGARALAKIPSATFALTKRTLREPVLQRVRDAAAIDAEVRQAWSSDVVQRAIRDYAERVLKK